MFEKGFMSLNAIDVPNLVESDFCYEGRGRIVLFDGNPTIKDMKKTRIYHGS